MKNTIFIGKVYHRFAELPSTNDWALELIATPSLWGGQGGGAKSKPPEGTVVRADSQSAGRGQHGSRWDSAAGKNLTLSVILHPIWLEAQAQFYLSMAVALALRDTVNGTRHTAHGAKSSPPLERSGREEGSPTEPATVHRVPCAAIKWPNDLYFAARKAAGILIQNTLSGQYLQTSIVGIGLNVNQMEFEPALPNPISLALFFEKKFDLDETAERLFERLERRYLQLKSGQRAAIKAEYEQSLFRLDVPSKFVRSADGSEFTGLIRGVTEAGRLRVETENGEETFEVKEVKFVL